MALWAYFHRGLFFFLSCCKHILKCIYNLYELWLSSILHKQSDKNAFLPLNLFLFGSFWPGSNNVVTVLYCSGDECQIWDSVKLFAPRRLDRCKRTQLCYQKKLAASNSGTANWNSNVNLWLFRNKLRESRRQFQNNWPLFFSQRGPGVNHRLLVFLCRSKIMSDTCSSSHDSFIFLDNRQLLTRTV